MNVVCCIVEHQTNMFFSPITFFERKKALRVISLVWPQGGGSHLEAALPFSSDKVQGVSFGVVLHILLLVHEPPEDDELPPPLHHRVKAGLGRPSDGGGGPVAVNPP